MKVLEYKIEIEAPDQEVWRALIEADKFKVWCKAFAPGSYFIGEWKRGSEIQFLADGMGGTVARIEEFKPYQRILADHIATLTKEGVRETTGEFTEKWVGTKEIYELEQKGEKTLLRIEIQTDPQFVEMFDSGWKKALPLLKNLVESQRS